MREAGGAGAEGFLRAATISEWKKNRKNGCLSWCAVSTFPAVMSVEPWIPVRSCSSLLVSTNVRRNDLTLKPAAL